MSDNGQRIQDMKYFAKEAIKKIWGEVDEYPHIYKISLYGLYDPELPDSERDMDTYLAYIQTGLSAADEKGKHDNPIEINRALINKNSLRGFDAKYIVETYGAAIDARNDEEMMQRLDNLLSDFVKTGGFCYVGLSDETLMQLRKPSNNGDSPDMNSETYPETDLHDLEI